MPRLYALGSSGLILVLFLLSAASAGWSMDQPREASAARFAPVSRLAPSDFQESWRDVMSGGIGVGLPYRMAVDSRGRILVTDSRLSIVHVFYPEQWKHSQIRGDRYHRFAKPTAVAIDSNDRIYVTDLQLSVVVVLEPDGTFVRWIGAGVLRVPTGISVDKQNQRVYVADWSRQEILCFDLDGTLLRAFGSWGSGPGQVHHPTDIVVQKDSVVVLDAGNARFTEFDLKGRFRGIRPFGFDHKPIAFALDEIGNLYYVDALFYGIIALDQQGKVLAGFGKRKFTCLTVDSLGRILVLREGLQIDVLKLVTGPND